MKLKGIVVFLLSCSLILTKAQYKLSYSDTLMYLGTQSYKELNLIGAKEKLDSCILLNPLNDECKYYRAKVEFDMKSYQNASVMFKNVLAIKETDASSWHMLGLCYTNLKYYDSAEFCFKNAVKLNSKRSEFYANWANNQFLRGNNIHAEQLYSTAILIDDKNAQYYAYRAEVREELGEKKKAEEDLELATSLDPENEVLRGKLNQSSGLSSYKLLYVSIGLTLLLFFALYYRGRKNQ
jgi:tetratricopeptide (TPR) repeat protein